MELMFQPLRKYADFQGRARRSEYWLFTLLILIVLLLLGLLSGLTGGDPESFGPFDIVAVGVALAVLIPSIAVTVRRLHDTNRSGWWYLISFIPLIGALVLIVFLVLPGTPGANRFGPDPKGGAPAEAFS